MCTDNLSFGESKHLFLSMSQAEYLHKELDRCLEVVKGFETIEQPSTKLVVSYPKE